MIVHDALVQLGHPEIIVEDEHAYRLGHVFSFSSGEVRATAPPMRAANTAPLSAPP